MRQRFNFSGAKIALLCEDKILTTLRDNFPEIPYPNHWDLPGGGREGDETPFECLVREVYEELGLMVTENQIFAVKTYPCMIDPTKKSVFMVGTMTPTDFENIIFGDEGQDYQLMPIDDWLNRTDVIPRLQERLREWEEQKSERDEIVDEL